jgi:16S rRNA (guanine966-N2)-methyltransferase
MSNQRNSVRIIGGRWRGRKLGFPSFDDLRPTGDRARETLFNWLAGRIEGSQCLDLFAGSGCLGFEALSRGAATVTFVELRTPVVAQLRAEWARLTASDAEGLGTARFERMDARAWLARQPPAPAVDIAFLDPPFAAGLLPALLPALAPLLAPDARVYVERPNMQPAPPLPAGWTLARESRTGSVTMCLYAVAFAGDGGMKQEGNGGADEGTPED